jgi:hypothetical protein
MANENDKINDWTIMFGVKRCHKKAQKALFLLVSLFVAKTAPLAVKCF